jgi:hypothetical protein
LPLHQPRNARRLEHVVVAVVHRAVVHVDGQSSVNPAAERELSGHIGGHRFSAPPANVSRELRM